MGVNAFNNGINKQEYLFKLLPDFGVFDIAERYFIDSNKEFNDVNRDQKDKLFFYENANHLISDIPFRRFIVKSNGTIEVFSKNYSRITEENDEVIYHSFTIGRDNYAVIIDEQNVAGPFNVSQLDGDYIIGVCF